MAASFELIQLLGKLCREYNSSTKSGSALVEQVHKSVSQPNAPKDVTTLLKRVERSCGRHFCKLWQECSKACQYEYVGGPLAFQTDIEHFAVLPNSQTRDGLVSPRGGGQGGNQAPVNVEDSEGFIMCQKDDAVQTAKLQDVRKLALERALAHMSHFSINQRKKQGEKRSSETDSSRHLKVHVEPQDDERSLAVPIKRPEVGSGDNPRLGDPTMDARVIPFRSVPVVDLSKPISVVASKIGEACRNVGFFYIVNHGVKPEVIDQQLEYSKRFFQLPPQRKRALDNRHSVGGIRGYFALGQENLNTAEGEQLARYHGDLKEGFDVGFEGAEEEFNKDFKLAGKNLWPDESDDEAMITGFREQSIRYYNEMLQLGRKLMSSFALALGLSHNFFEPCLQHPVATLRLLHYPPQNPSDTSDKLGCGAHTDYGCCTILLQDATGGLQVRNSKMQWIHAPPVPGSFIINIGDMMSRWTNNVFSSTVHRVANTGSGQRDRYSIPFFLNPSFNTTIECLPTCVNEGHSPKFNPATCEDILMERYSETFEHLRQKG